MVSKVSICSMEVPLMPLLDKQDVGLYTGGMVLAVPLFNLKEK